MTKYSTTDHVILPIIAWDPARPAEWINDHIAMAYGTSNSYVVLSDEGDVVINTGTAQQGAGMREKLEALIGRPLNVAKLVFTQSHPDHTGGWQAFAGPNTEIFGHRMFPQICAERKMLGKFFQVRNWNVLSAMIPPGTEHNWFATPDPEPMTTFADETSFSIGGRTYQLISVPTGETLDSLAVWIEAERTLFTGNWAGAIIGALPNFYTARGDRDRSIPGWISDCNKLLALEPELLITGHERPVEGKEAIAAGLTKVRNAVQYIHDHTVEGMVSGRTLPEIQASLRLPEELTPRVGRCEPHWIARSVWEEYTGWFRQERTSELYATPPSAIWSELAEMAGGPDALVERAKAHLSAGEAEKALHFIEMAVATAPDSRAVRETELTVLDTLADRTKGEIFDLLGWLEGRISASKKALAETR